ncbi:MAG TPA: histidine kinase [Gemmatimonadaceae bacterium]|jgi:signal transduction histidine kinase|nr:histidine kinase [Gemmatimonadaceae bacterium]
MMDCDESERRLRAGLVAGGAVLLVLVLTAQLYVWINLWPVRIGVLTAFVWSIPQVLLWSLTIPLIDALATRWPVEGRGAAWRLAGHVLASVSVALLVLLTLDLSDRALGWTALMGAPGTLVTAIDKTILHTHIGIAIYWVVLAANHARGYYRRLGERELRAARLETELAEAQLGALRMQLDPHFLFNTLNSIGVLMRRDPDAASRMLGRLGDFLRSTLDHAGSSEVSVATELEYVRAYLEIEQVRFGGRLATSVTVEPGLEQHAVPYLILQPLVENAVKHGVARRSAPGTVRVDVRSDGDRLTLTVRDDGPGPSLAGASRGSGVGLANVARRLEHSYGADQHLELRAAPDGGAVARVVLPRRTVGSPGQPRVAPARAARSYTGPGEGATRPHR